MAVRPKASAPANSAKRHQSFYHGWCAYGRHPSLRGCPAPSASHPPPSTPAPRIVQEVIIVVLDVGPQMSDHLEHVRKSLFLLAESKV